MQNPTMSATINNESTTTEPATKVICGGAQMHFTGTKSSPRYCCYC